MIIVSCQVWLIDVLLMLTNQFAIKYDSEILIFCFTLPLYAGLAEKLMGNEIEIR